MKQKLVRIGISGIQKQKERFCLIFPVLLFIFIFPASSIAQTIAEEYNFNFKGGEERGYGHEQRKAAVRHGKRSGKDLPYNDLWKYRRLYGGWSVP